MKYIKYFIIVAALNLTSISFSRSEEMKVDNSLNKIYINSQRKLQNGNFDQAIKQLEEINNRYPFGSFSQNIQLNLIYAYYKNTDLFLAKSTIDRFIRLNPTHPHIDYVMYMRGITNMALDSGVLHGFFFVDHSDRDPKYARDAFYDFLKLTRNYPDSQYISDAIKRLIFLKNRLAKYEYFIADYYMRRKAWVAVINRVENMLRDYPDTQATRNGLKLMENAYRKMKMFEQAEKVSKIISANKN